MIFTKILLALLIYDILKAIFSVWLERSDKKSETKKQSFDEKLKEKMNEIK